MYNWVNNILVLFFLVNFCVNAQVEQQNEVLCYCDEMPELENIIDCNPKVFDNSSKIYWRYSCDSSWLVFETAEEIKQILFSLEKDMLEYTTSLGYDDFYEFNNVILVSNSPAAGCCYLPDYYLHDKNTGNLIAYLGRAIFASEDRKIPFVVSLTESKYASDVVKNYNSLSIYHLEKNELFTVPLPKSEISRAMKKNDFFFPEELFLASILDNNVLTLVYFSGKKKQKTISIDLNKYN